MRPIIFSAPMVRALLEGRKTQTRRLAWRLKEDPAIPGTLEAIPVPSPWQKAKPGDLLWVRETWALGRSIGDDLDVWRGPIPKQPSGFLFYRENATHAELWDDSPWRSPLHMPRWASRITLEVTATRIERLQDISEADAEAEGAERMTMDDDAKFYLNRERGTYRTGFAGLWSHLHGPGSWDANPEVVALTFRVHLANVDALMKERAA
ncbi:MAG: hypothetical protein KIT20_12255 [Alphaproteobacteria bacterium]|nr:hypothetical protein [Alphaproteobacteria bacterium]